MADNVVAPSRGEKALDKVKSGAGVLAAIVGSITALYGVYEKVKSDARDYTTTSYEVLAPKLNEMNDALRKLQEENQQLKEAVAGRVPRVASPKPAARPASKSGGASAEARRPAGEPAPAAAAPSGAVVPGTPSAPAAAAPAGTPGAPEAAPPAGEPDRLKDIFGAVNQARDAVQSIRKVPDTFEKVLQQKKP